MQKINQSATVERESKEYFFEKVVKKMGRLKRVFMKKPQNLAEFVGLRDVCTLKVLDA